MPAHPGKEFCGDGFAKTIVSSENYMRFLFKSDDTPSGRGFSASLRLIDGKAIISQFKTLFFVQKVIAHHISWLSCLTYYSVFAVIGICDFKSIERISSLNLM